MAAILITSEDFAQQLQGVGMPPAQAKVVAQGLAAMYVQHFDSLVTKDYLDTRFDEFASRIGRELDQRFVQVDQQFAGVEQRFAKVEQRFAEQKADFEQRFIEQKADFGQHFARIDQRFIEQKAEFDQKFAGIETRLASVTVMQGVILAALALPVLQAVLQWST